MLNINLAKCVSCFKCVRLYPDILFYLERGFREYFCRRCRRPACVEVCRNSALSLQSGSVKRDISRCAMCKKCSFICPFSCVPEVLMSNMVAPLSDHDISGIMKYCDREAVTETRTAPENSISVSENIRVMYSK